jgi:hypothetical protein
VAGQQTAGPPPPPPLPPPIGQTVVQTVDLTAEQPVVQTAGQTAATRPAPEPGPHVPPPPAAAEPPPLTDLTAEAANTRTIVEAGVMMSNGEVVTVPIDEIPPNQTADDQPAGPGEDGRTVDTPRPRRGRPVGSRNRPKVDLDPDAPFRPDVFALHATAKRVVNVGAYESFEVQAHIQAEPDPRHTMMTNISGLIGLVVWQVNQVADEVGREIKLGKG